MRTLHSRQGKLADVCEAPTDQIVD